MDLKDALKEIKSRVKPYTHVAMSQSTFSTTVRHIEAGLAKTKTIENFMQKFGYDLKKEEVWIKSVND